MAYPYVDVCFDFAPNAACSAGPWGEGVTPTGLLNASAWVRNTPGPCPAGIVNGGGSFTPVNQLASGACIGVFSDTSSMWVPASSVQFGNPYSYVPPFTFGDLDASTMAEVYAAAFVMTGALWAAGRALGGILEFMK